MSTLRAGDIVRHPDASVSKVLVVDEDNGAIHVRFYDGEYADKEVVVAAIAARTLEWSIGHVPMSLVAFDKDLELVTNVTVTEDELEGYRLYLEATSGDHDTAAEKVPAGKEGFFAKLARLLGGST